MAAKSHVLVLIFPLQGHINPMLQFSKRIASKGIKVTVVTTSSIKIQADTQSELMEFECIPERINQEVIEKSAHLQDAYDAFIERLKAEVLEHLPLIFERKASSGEPLKVLVYDSLMPYAFDVAKKFGIQGAAFFTQSSSVCAIYYHLHEGTLKFPLPEPNISLPSVPIVLRSKDLPSLICERGSHPSILRLILCQNLNFHKADWLLFNTFECLEHQAVSWMASHYPKVKTIGPTIPSIYLDKRLEDDKDYGLTFFKPETKACKQWLDTKSTGTVVYASFGSMANLTEAQMVEIAWGLANSQCYFLWVVRASEENKIPRNFAAEVGERGLIVNWCPQLEVLAHHAVGCFLTHCGWNSTLEALSLGVPMVVMPQWLDQPANSKFIVDVWQIGVGLTAGEDGVVRREELEVGIREAMVGDRSIKLKKNAVKWKDLAKEAMSEGGSSDKNIEQFVSSFLAN